MDKSHRGNASQFFVAGELCRRGYAAVVTMGNTPNTDILCSNREGTRFVHIQVKTFVPGNRTVSVGTKSERDYGARFVWVLAGIPLPESGTPFEYYIIPSSVVAKNVRAGYEKWLKTPGAKGQAHNENTVRTIHLPPHKSIVGWNISKYRNKWAVIESLLESS